MTKQQHLLIKMMEECGEVTQAASKVLLFGAGDAYKDGVPNTDSLLVEMNDLFTLMAMVQAELKLDTNDLGFTSVTRTKQKMEKVEKFMGYARERGILEKEKS